ncbi:Uncharacterised protein [uncultured archaeon]|nr:Uncharacterised protein [uncultured archaeon]
MALRRVKGAFSSPRALKTALDLRRKGISREEIIAALHKKYFPKYTLEEVQRIYSPKGGWSSKIVSLVDEPGVLTNRQVLEKANAIRKSGTSKVSSLNKNRTPGDAIAQAASDAMKKKHRSRGFKRNIRKGTQKYWNSDIGAAHKLKVTKQILDAQRINPQGTRKQFVLGFMLQKPNMATQMDLFEDKPRNKRSVASAALKQTRLPLFRKEIAERARANMKRLQSDSAFKHRILTGIIRHNNTINLRVQ